MGTNSNSSLKNLLIYTAISSSVISLPYDTCDLTPNTEMKLSTEYNIADWKDLAFNKSTNYSILDEDSLKVQAIMDFSKKVIANTHDIDEEFVDIVNENFWELI